MKKKNSVSDFEEERRRFLLTSFRRAIALQSEIDREKAFRTAADVPAPRFWVSENRAAAVIGKFLAGEDPTLSMLPEKRLMYREIYSRFLRLRAERPSESIAELLFEVVNDSAPRSYMSWQTARTIVYKERRRLRRERREI